MQAVDRRPVGIACIVFSALIWGLAGCAAKPLPVVYVDTARIASTAPPPIGRRAEAIAQPDGGALTLPFLPESKLSMGSVGPALDRAHEIRAKNKQRAFEEVYRRLRTVAFEEARREAEAEIKALEPTYREAMDAVYRDARPLFEQFAEPAFGYRVKLSNLVGFPDPDPRSRRQPEGTDELGRQRFEKAKSYRDSLDELSALFWLEFDRRRVAVESDLSAKKARIRVRMVEREEILDAAAREQARHVVNGNGNGNGQVTTLDLRGDLPAQPSLGVRLASSPPRLASTVIAPSDWRSVQQDGLRSELEVWAAVHGYRLAKTPAEGRDATDEFVVWRKSYRAGL